MTAQTPFLNFFPRVIAPAAISALLVTTAIGSAYFGLLVLLMGGVRIAKIQLFTYGPWMALLAIGFTLQLFLFFYQRRYVRDYAQGCGNSSTTLIAGGGASGTAMLACCAHHLFEILPFLGLGALGAFFGRYQLIFIEIGIISNVLGVFWMLTHIQKHKLYPPAMAVFFGFNFSRATRGLIYVSVAYLFFALIRVLS